jgi:hypothetical protein
LFLNAHHYTDASIGDFMPRPKQTLVEKHAADHHRRPRPSLPETRKDKPSEFHIPMLWLGGALKMKST